MRGTMREQRIKVWVQKFKDRPMLMLQWIDPDTGARKSKSAKTADPEAAEKARADHEYELNHRIYQEPSKLTWERFREMYEAEHVSGLAAKSGKKISSVFNSFERHANPKRLEQITERTISLYVTKLRSEGRSVATINGHLRHLKHALRWATEQRLRSSCPRIKKLKELKKLPRKITTEEFERLLAKATSDDWRALLLTGWYTGMRLGELLALTWNEIDFPNRRILCVAETTKARRDEWLPMNSK